MVATSEPAQELDMRVYAVDLDAPLHDIRELREMRPELYHPSSYGMSRALAARLRAGGSNAVVYASVRHERGQCAAVFRPKFLQNCRQRHLCYVWDGKTIVTVYEKKSFQS